MGNQERRNDTRFRSAAALAEHQMKHLRVWWQRLLRKISYLPERRALTWTKLRTIGHLPAIKATIFVPLIGYLIIFNDTIARYLTLIWDTDATPLPSTNLMLVYFGLVFLSVGSIVYAIFCDRRIDKYGSPEAFIGGDGPNISAVTVGEFKKQLVDAGYDLDAWREDGITAVGRLDEKKEILTVIYEKLDRAFPAARSITTIFYVIGFAVLAIPSVRVFLKVLQILAARIFF